jgi:accessory colonization factor AcfC
MQTRAVLVLAVLVLALPSVAPAQVVRSGAGANSAAILNVVNQFRTDLKLFVKA